MMFLFVWAFRMRRSLRASQASVSLGDLLGLGNYEKEKAQDRRFCDECLL